MNKFTPPIVSLALCFGLTACQPPAQEANPPRPVWVMKIQGDQAGRVPSFTGEVRSRYESNVGFRVAGKIISRDVNVGDLVKKGQRIAQLDPSDIRLNAQAASAEVQSAKASLALAQAELQRRQQLYQQQFISKSALDSYETQVKTAQARVQQAQAQASLSQQQTGYTQLLADREGVVAMIQAEPGQVVAAGQTVAQIYDLRTPEIQMAVPESLIAHLHVGDAAQITLTETGVAATGRIREIAPAANPQTHAFDLRIQLVNADPRIKLGMTAQVRLATAEHQAASIVVPTTAVSRRGEQAIVWVIDTQSQAHARPVTTGDISEAGMAITSGLQAGESIATIGVHTLTEGMQVQAVTPGPEVLR